MQRNRGNSPSLDGHGGALRVIRAGLGIALAIMPCLGLTPARAFADTATNIEEARKTCVRLYSEAEKVNEELNGTKVRIDELNEKIDQIEASIQDDRTSLRIQMRDGYKSGDAFGVLGNIMNSDSLEEMIDNVEYSDKIQAENKSNIQSVMSATKDLRDARNDLNALYDKQSVTKKDFDARLAEANKYMASLTDGLRKELGLDSQDASWDVPAEISAGTGEAWRDVVLTCAYANLGGEYVWGGEEFKAADCSGLSKWCYAKAGVDIPHYSEDQAEFCNKPMSEALPGDVAWRPGHIGICIGGGRTIEAMSPAMGITYGTTDGFIACGSPI